MSRFAGLTIVFLLGATFLIAQTAEERAQTAYQQQLAKDYAGAIANYKGLLDEGYASVDLHFNLGMAYYRNDQLGYAIWQLEKALKLNPNDSEVDKNLQLIRNEQADGLLPLPTFFLKSWWQSMAARLSVNTWSILAVLLMVTGCLALAARLWYRRQATPPSWWNGWQGRLLPVGISLVFLAVLFTSFANTRQHVLSEQKHGIVLTETTQVRVAPAADADTDFEIHEGLHTRILDEFESWIKIGLVDGREGWLNAIEVGKI